MDKAPTDIAKWVEEMKDRFARALYMMESSKNKAADMDKLLKKRAEAGKPLKNEELRQNQLRREQQLISYAEAHKWVESVRRQHESLHGDAEQLCQNGAAGSTTAPSGQRTEGTLAANAKAAQNKPHHTNQSAQALTSSSKSDANFDNDASIVERTGPARLRANESQVATVARMRSDVLDTAQRTISSNGSSVSTKERFEGSLTSFQMSVQVL